MSPGPCRVVVFGHDSRFFDYAVYHLATAGLCPVPVESDESLFAEMRVGRPSMVLLHWDTLKEQSLDVCALLKSMIDSEGTTLILLSERLDGGPNVGEAFASGADGLITGAMNPKIFLPRVRALLRRGAPKGPLPFLPNP